MTEQAFNALFLCTGNSARSIIGEAILNKVGTGRFHAYSAGSHPQGKVHPQTLELLQRLGYDTMVLRSKSWEEFTNAPRFDFIFTVCDNAAAEVCPVWPGHPMTVHWGVPDPAEVVGSGAVAAHAFADAYRILYQRIGSFMSSPLRSLDQLTLKKKLSDIGHLSDMPAKVAEAN